MTLRPLRAMHPRTRNVVHLRWCKLAALVVPALCQVEWSSPGTKYRLGANMLGFGKIPGGSVSGCVLDTVEVII